MKRVYFFDVTLAIRKDKILFQRMNSNINLVLDNYFVTNEEDIEKLQVMAIERKKNEMKEFNDLHDLGFDEEKMKAEGYKFYYKAFLTNWKNLDN